MMSMSCGSDTCMVHPTKSSTISDVHFLDVLASLKILQSDGLGMGSRLAHLKGIQLCLIDNGFNLQWTHKFTKSESENNLEPLPISTCNDVA